MSCESTLKCIQVFLKMFSNTCPSDKSVEQSNGNEDKYTCLKFYMSVSMQVSHACFQIYQVPCIRLSGFMKD